MPKLFVSGFPLDMNELDLAKLIAIHGDIDTLKIIRDKNTRICKGYAFVEMKNIDGAQAAVEALNGEFFHGKALTVNINNEPEVD